MQKIVRDIGGYNFDPFFGLLVARGKGDFIKIIEDRTGHTKEELSDWKFFFSLQTGTIIFRTIQEALKDPDPMLFYDLGVESHRYRKETVLLKMGKTLGIKNSFEMIPYFCSKYNDIFEMPVYNVTSNSGETVIHFIERHDGNWIFEQAPWNWGNIAGISTVFGGKPMDYNIITEFFSPEEVIKAYSFMDHKLSEGSHGTLKLNGIEFAAPAELEFVHAKQSNSILSNRYIQKDDLLVTNQAAKVVNKVTDEADKMFGILITRDVKVSDRFWFREGQVWGGLNRRIYSRIKFRWSAGNIFIEFFKRKAGKLLGHQSIIEGLEKQLNQNKKLGQEIQERKDLYAAKLVRLNVELEDKVIARTRELEATNQELQAVSAKIREADRLKSEFLANMSHELRTPMNAIIGFTRLVRRKSADILPPKQLENLEKVETSANQLLKLINDILDLSKIEAGKMGVSIMPFHLAPLVDTCFATVEPMVQEEKVRLLKDLPGDLPEILSDQDKLKQIIINLLSNALKFTEQGEVKLAAALENVSLRITVSDTGIGIPAHALGYIFDEFRQADGSTTRKHGGTGLGLSITRNLTHLLGGTIDVQSVEGLGSTFTVTIPLATAEVEAPADKVLQEKVGLPSAEIKARKVLLAIDDDPNVLSLLRQNLEEEGYYVVGALNAEEGIRKAKELHPFAVTLDILMPNKDGWGVLSDLKADPATRDIPIILLSIIDNKELGFSLGAFDYLLKPFDKESILATLQRIQGMPAKRVLLVDDEPAAVDLLTQILHDEGYQVKGTYSGEEALRALEAAPQDIILLDLLMPGMDGFEVIQRVRANPRLRNIPIIVVTAKDLTDADRGFLCRGADRIIQKAGLSGETLMKEVRRLLRENDIPGKEDLVHEEGPGGGGC